MKGPVTSQVRQEMARLQGEGHLSACLTKVLYLPFSEPMMRLCIDVLDLTQGELHAPCSGDKMQPSECAHQGPGELARLPYL